MTVVTGAGRGIGAAIAHRLARDGDRVLVTDRDQKSAEATAKSITLVGGVAAAARVDVMDSDAVAAVPAITAREFGVPPHVVVCNAGLQTFATAESLPAVDWDRVMDTNGRGTLLSLQMAAAVLPNHSDACVVTIASIQARLAGPYYPHYSASKAAVLSLTRSFAMALAPRGIRVNSVAPGIVDTELWDLADREMARLRGVDPGVPRRERLGQVPLGRAGTPDDIAGAVAFLASPDASYITGECLHVCGGDVML